MTVEMTSDDLLWVAEKVYQIGGLKQPYEAAYAVLGGWDFLEFTSLYTAYIDSTQIDLHAAGNRTTEAKGDPLEHIARYFLEKGGISKNIKPGGIPGRWTLDGVGETYPDRLDKILGAGSANKCGPQLYMEAKNHAAAMGPELWAQHCSRMQRHGCTLSIVFSTGGYPMRAGMGYADELFHDWSRWMRSTARSLNLGGSGSWSRMEVGNSFL